MKFLLKDKPDKDGLVRLRDEDYHYLVNVRRLKPGSVFTVLLSSKDNFQEEISQEASVTVISIDNQTLTGSVSYKKTSPASLTLTLPEIILFQALPKGAKMDLIVRQAAELGINEVVPFVSEHSIPKKSTRDGRTGRWRRIIKEARQQSGSAVDTGINDILSMDELFAYWEQLQAENRGSKKGSPLGLIFSPIAKSGFHRYLYKKPPLLVLAVGPEGGDRKSVV